MSTITNMELIRRNINDETLEETLSAVRRAKAINAVKSIQQQSVKNGLDKITLKEINAEIKKSRE
ncbi:MAG: hypothetical protein LBJ00_03660 [Planctomycetaceae bacterium]|nr:hypothetical protein [Planctomycetaceae bacterium]